LIRPLILEKKYAEKGGDTSVFGGANTERWLPKAPGDFARLAVVARQVHH